MNCTWLAFAYDTDDVPYRLATLLQIGGVLVGPAASPPGLRTTTSPPRWLAM